MKNYYNVLAGFKVGDRIVGPKSSVRWIQHHVIYLGFYNGDYWFIENKQGYGVRVITAYEFFSDLIEITRIEPFIPRWNYSRDDLFRYALSKKGRAYDLLNYNCETFANDVQHQNPESSQANTGKVVGITAVLALLLIWGLGGSRSKE
jgi:hypothetical protein